MQLHWAESDSSIHWIEGFKLILNNLYFQKRRAPGLWNPGAFSPPRSFNNRVYWPANGLSGMVVWVGWKRTKSREAGMWGLKPFREPANGDKAENEFSPLYPHSLLTVGCFAPHSHPSPPEEKAASRKKSRLRRKKTLPDAKNGASCVSRVSCPYLWAGIVCGCVLNVRV